MSAGFKDHFSNKAAAYAAHRPTYPPALAEFLAEISPGRDCAWDCGCGSGQLSVLLAPHFARVIGTDASAQQIRKAKAHPRVSYMCAPAEESGLPAHSCDVIVAAQAAHWFDLDRFYQEVRRVGRPGAAIALISYGIFRIDSVIDPVIARFYTGTLGPYWPPERRHVEEGYRSLAFPFPELAPPAFAIAVDWNFIDLLGYITTWSAVAALERAGGGAAFAAFREELGRAWGHPETKRTVRWPIALRAGHIGSRAR